MMVIEAICWSLAVPPDSGVLCLPDCMGFETFCDLFMRRFSRNHDKCLSVGPLALVISSLSHSELSEGLRVRRSA
jgi:hypothetical protein